MNEPESQNQNQEQERILNHIFKFLLSPAFKNSTYALTPKSIKEGLELAGKVEYEYLMFSHHKFFSLSELNQYKLYLLIKHVFKYLIPTEYEVTQIFSITTLQATTLIKNTYSMYQFELEQALRNTIGVVLEQPRDGNAEDGYLIRIRSKYLLNEMNEILAYKRETDPPIRKMNSETNAYKISDKAKQTLKEYATGQ
jgi:hypothetical protein